MLSRIRTFVRPTVAAVLAVTALGGAAPIPATEHVPVTTAAGPPQILLEFNYYSNASRTTLVGRAVEYCDGTYQLTWGVQTAYQRVYPYYCPD